MEPWLVELSEGRTQAAWDLFAERYRRLMLATIKRLVPDHDDVMDVFSTVCQALTANDFARLRRYYTQNAQRASVATWLVAVVRNLTIDWLRQHEGRRRPTVPAHLSSLQQEIYRAVCLDGSSHVEAYEIIESRSASGMSFPEFLREVRATHRAAPCPNETPARGAARAPVSDDLAAPSPALDPVETAELARRIADALASHPDDVRLAVELFVVERMPAADVARVVGWPNGKA
ncbi:MAG: sigma-70 family RNA polymerase sigma factor, partial [Gemmatimonadota bacterium]|nr:sigma-70 family RNA polymerase sigma factor [Gemmatimonadota bacterium]